VVSFVLCSISPGNIWTDLWMKAAQQVNDPECMIQSGRDAQVGIAFSTVHIMIKSDADENAST